MAIKNDTLTFEHRHLAGSAEPGPPVHPIPLEFGEDSLTDATSNDGSFGFWPLAHSQATLKQATTSINGLTIDSFQARTYQIGELIKLIGERAGQR